MKSQGLSYFLSNTYRARADILSKYRPGDVEDVLRIMYIMLNSACINKAIK